MKLNPDTFFTKSAFALFGLSDRKGGVSLQIYRLLAGQGYKVLPINPNRSEVTGVKCYSSLNKLPEQVEAAIVVTNPQISKNIAQECKQAGISEIWFQYNTMDDELKDWCDQNEINWIQSCVLLHHNGAGFPHNAHRFLYKLFVRH